MNDTIMIFVWLGLTIIFAIIELVTVQLATVWFAFGAFVSMLLAIFGVKSIAVQTVVFVIISLASLIATRPLVKKLINKKAQPTNADMAIGKTAVVTVPIDTVNGTGEVKLGGAYWSAKSTDENIIQAGAQVRVLRIEGVKLIVETI